MTTSKQEAIKHHYVPQFYLEQWAGPDGKLCVTKRLRERLLQSRLAPKSTGYEHRLYSFRDEPFLPNHEPDVIEKKILSIIDDGGARVHRRLLNENLDDLTGDERKAWAVFLNAMLERNPVRILHNESTATQIAEQVIHQLERKAQSKEEHRRIRIATKLIDPAAAAANLVRRSMIDEMRNDHVVQYLESMRWFVLTVPAELELHTSNRPFVVKWGQQRTPISVAWIPISPLRLFVLLPNSWCLDEGTDSRREIDKSFRIISTYHNLLLLQERPERLYTRKPLSADEQRAATKLLTCSTDRQPGC